MQQLKSLESLESSNKYKFYKCDICDIDMLKKKIFTREQPDKNNASRS